MADHDLPQLGPGIRVSCGFCHELVDVTGGPAECPGCHHYAGLPRWACPCPKCQPQGRPLPLPVVALDDAPARLPAELLGLDPEPEG